MACRFRYDRYTLIINKNSFSVNSEKLFFRRGEFMFEKITPEKAGVKSENVLRFLKFLENNGLTMHSVLLMKGDALFGEYYWTPFDKDFCHRMYSQTKSYVSVAIGLLEEEGKLKLDDTMVSYFPEKIDGELHPFMKAQTIRDMLTMTTCAHAPYWFNTKAPDRTHEYINNSEVVRPSGTMWEYDSPGSQVLASLVEKLSGMSLLDYLNEKIFKHLGTFKTAEILKTRNGDSWGDSALICTSRDMASFARFVMNYGEWNGKRLMNEAYLRAATSNQVSNNTNGFEGYDSVGYGYQIWCNDMGGFGFNGMGGQFTIAVPEKDMIFVCNADNQGYLSASALIFRALKEFIVSEMGEPMKDNLLAYSELESFGKTLKLRACVGEAHTELENEINGKKFICQKNRTGIKNFSFKLDGDSLIWNYENEQGEKSLRFGLCRNEFGKFPQLGYSNDYGGTRTTDGFMYKCAASAGWTEARKLALRVQVIDRYFGNFNAEFAFKGELCAVRMEKTAEDFFYEYEGEFTAKAE